MDKVDAQNAIKQLKIFCLQNDLTQILEGVNDSGNPCVIARRTIDFSIELQRYQVIMLEYVNDKITETVLLRLHKNWL